MHLSCLFVQCLLLIFGLPIGQAIGINELYQYSNENQLEHGLDAFKFLKVDTPIHLFSDTYDHIYLNTKGIITFGNDLPNFINIPFPLEYAAIAPFYSNVDTTNANSSTSISFSNSRSGQNVQRATDTVRGSFSDAIDFDALDVFVITWENVGRYNEKNDLQNTFQVAIICGEEDTYVEFLYPENALNWLQSDIGESGLPDVRSQAGFVSGDGRYFNLKGSGTENVKYLTELSNNGKPGSWLFRVGPLGFEDSIEEPDQVQSPSVDFAEPVSCGNGGRLKCHTSAICKDTPKGFCCKCKSGFYGNGFSCIKNEVPIRVAGKVSGYVGDTEINAQLQSYVVLTDGRSYTAISPLTKDIGYNVQLLYALGGSIGWLFAKSVGGENTLNGYQITGGKLNHTTTLKFENTSDEVVIIQTIDGLNVWDQLSVDTDIKGNIPYVPANVPVTFPDITNEYVYETDNSLRSFGKSTINAGGDAIPFTIEQQIEFYKCPYSDSDNTVTQPPFFEKITKITTAYQERETAVRIGMINKLINNVEVNPCTDGTATCGENSICVPEAGADSYTCECRNGFTLYEDESGQHCVDIDECSGINICDPNAECFNELGGYSCRCRDGYSGNGHNCESIATNEVSTEQQHQLYTTPEPYTVPTPNIPSLAPEHWLCDQCSEHAECFKGVCVCKSGWTGNGVECTYNCPPDFEWSVDRCIPVNPPDDDELELTPFCHENGCSCPTGYELIQTTNTTQICKLIGKNTGGTSEEDVKLPCDVEDNCSSNASCEWVESELRNKCICNPGYEGNGYKCVEHEVSCLFEDICDVHASCVYEELIGKSVCKCEKRYEGDGRRCQLAPECRENSECAENSACNEGVCSCKEGYERDISDFCVPSGFCGGTYCAENAVCQWDNVEKIQYCLCPEGFVGDGVRSCKSVPPPCNVRNNCGLYATCAPIASAEGNPEYACLCNPGYYGDGLICVPEINCVNVPSLCHANAKCISTSAGLKCICNTGFIGNGSHCTEPVRETNGFLLLSQGVTIVKIPVDGKRGSPVIASSMSMGVDKDCAHGRIYWTDISLKQIWSSKYDGTDKQPFITEDLISPEGVALDWISRRLYWTDSTKDTIEVATLDNPKIRAVIVRKDLVNPRGIAVDPHQNKLYWSDWNRDAPKIEWSNLDGTEREVLLSAPAVQLPNYLTISQNTGELCFADAGTQKVECIVAYSRAVRTIASNLSYPFGLAASDERLFWTDWTTKQIESADQNGNRYPGIASPIFGSHKMYGIVAVTSNCPLFFSQCQVNNGDCPNERICLINTKAPSGRSCYDTQAKPYVDEY